ncbi:MAG: hypothetical protein AAF570_26985, partial [Bacteroidota bacterium]
MKHWKSWFLVLGMLWTARAQAQETLVSDENMIAPFEGLISYKITYSGVQRGMKSDLPDSMTADEQVQYRIREGNRVQGTFVDVTWRGGVLKALAR